MITKDLCFTLEIKHCFRVDWIIFLPDLNHLGVNTDYNHYCHVVFIINSNLICLRSDKYKSKIKYAHRKHISTAMNKAKILENFLLLAMVYRR